MNGTEKSEALKVKSRLCHFPAYFPDTRIVKTSMCSHWLYWKRIGNVVTEVEEDKDRALFIRRAGATRIPPEAGILERTAREVVEIWKTARIRYKRASRQQKEEQTTQSKEQMVTAAESVRVKVENLGVGKIRYDGEETLVKAALFTHC